MTTARRFALESRPAADAFGVLVGMNALMIAFNLVPFPGLDGALAWKIVPMLRGRWEDRWRAVRRKREQRQRDVAARASRAGLRVVRDDSDDRTLH